MMALILVLLFTLTGCSGTNTTSVEHRDHVLPLGYTGWVFVEHGIPEAAPLPQQEGREIANIPDSGFLQVQAPHRSTRIVHRYQRAAGAAIPALREERLTGDEERAATRSAEFVCCGGTVEEITDGRTRTLDYFYVGRGPAGERPAPPPP